MQAQGVGYVIEDAHGEGRGLLENHAHAAAQLQQVDLRGEDVLPVEQHLALGAVVAVELEDAVVDAQVGGFAAAGGSDDGGDFVLGDVEIVVEERLVFPIVEVEVARGDFNVFVHGRYSGWQC